MIIVIAWHASHRWCCSKITKTDNSHHQGRIRWLDWPGDWQWSVKWKDQKFYRKRIDNVILTAWISWCSSCCIIMDGCSTRSVSSAPSGVCHPDADTHRRKKSNPIQSIEESASYVRGSFTWLFIITRRVRARTSPDLLWSIFSRMLCLHTPRGSLWCGMTSSTR